MPALELAAMLAITTEQMQALERDREWRMG